MNNLSKQDIIEQYEDHIRDTSMPVYIAGIDFDAAKVLAELDPVAYRVGLMDFVDHLVSDEVITEEYIEQLDL